MAGQELEIILTQQFADSLSLPVFLTDPEGNLLFYNEPAEEILGRRYEETGSLPVKKWASIFKPKDNEGKPLEPAQLPLVQTLNERKPAHGSFWIESLNGQKYFLSVTSFPIIGRANRYLGAMAVFWKDKT